MGCGMTFLDFFAGIGGFRRGMEQAGHTCIGFCEFDKFAVASYIAIHLLTDEQIMAFKNIPAPPKKNGSPNLNKRQKEIWKAEYIHGEWYANDINRIFARDIPQADCWCFGFPCQDISAAGQQLGFRGKRSSLFFRVMRLIQDLEEKDRPAYLLIENVKNLLSVNGGADFLRLLIALDECGYDAEWQVINSADYLPHNRERIFIVGHLRGRCTHKVFPLPTADRKNNLEQLGNFMPTKKRANPNQGRIYAPEGISPCLGQAGGGGRTPYVILPRFCDMSPKGGLYLYDKAFCLQARYQKGASNRRGETSGVAVPVGKHGVVVAAGAYSVVIPAASGSVYAVWSDRYQQYVAIRQLTPKECFRLQGWEDTYFDRAALVNSDSQLYAQAGNGVTVPVVRAIGEKMQILIR